MKKTKIFIAFLVVGMSLMFATTSARAVPVVSLDLPPSVAAGDSFGVGVVVDAVTFPDELIAFGFDVVTPATFTYNGATVDSAFSDDSAFFPATDVAGSAFPGVTGTNILLATLSFTTSLPGLYSVGISSDLFDLNEGLALFNLFTFPDPLPMDMSTSAYINVTAPDPVPEPATIALLGIGIAGLGGGAVRRKWKNKGVDSS